MLKNEKKKRHSEKQSSTDPVTLKDDDLFEFPEEVDEALKEVWLVKGDCLQIISK